MKKRIFLVFFVLMSLVTLSACSHKLDGTYSGKFTLLFMEQKDDWVFDGDKVTEKQNGKSVRTGTYTIDDDQLKIKMNDVTIKARLSKDRKSFVFIPTGGGLSGMPGGIEYTKQEK